MKRLCVLWFLIFSIHGFSQSAIESYPVQISEWKTSNIVFPYAIKSVDRGSKDLLVQKANGVENVLQLKAAKKDFLSTNLSVITADGKLFSFIISYAAQPAILNISFVKDSLSNQKAFMHYHTFSEGAELSLNSIYLIDEKLWFNLELKNNSIMDYHPEFIHFFIEDKRKAARTAVQETDLVPLYAATHPPMVPGNRTKKFAIAFTPFSFSKDKKMVLQISEHNGGRQLTLYIPHRALRKVRAPLR